MASTSAARAASHRTPQGNPVIPTEPDLARLLKPAQRGQGFVDQLAEVRELDVVRRDQIEIIGS